MPENPLGAVAVMHIEIQHRDACQPMHLKRALCGNRRRAKEAKSHRSLALGMVPRRADGDKGTATLSHHRIHRRAGPAHRPHRSEVGAG